MRFWAGSQIIPLCSWPVQVLAAYKANRHLVLPIFYWWGCYRWRLFSSFILYSKSLLHPHLISVWKSLLDLNCGFFPFSLHFFLRGDSWPQLFMIIKHLPICPLSLGIWLPLSLALPPHQQTNQFLFLNTTPPLTLFGRYCPRTRAHFLIVFRSLSD